MAPFGYFPFLIMSGIVRFIVNSSIGLNFLSKGVSGFLNPVGGVSSIPLTDNEYASYLPPNIGFENFN